MSRFCNPIGGADQPAAGRRTTASVAASSVAARSSPARQQLRHYISLEFPFARPGIFEFASLLLLKFGSGCDARHVS